MKKIIQNTKSIYYTNIKIEESQKIKKELLSILHSTQVDKQSRSNGHNQSIIRFCFMNPHAFDAIIIELLYQKTVKQNGKTNKPKW